MKRNKLQAKGQLSPMTTEERLFIPLVLQVLNKSSRLNPYKSNELVFLVNSLAENKGIKKQIGSARLRKIINYIRAKELAYVISGSLGYYLSTDEEEIENMVVSLETRAASINSAAYGLRQLLNQLRFERSLRP